MLILAILWCIWWFAGIGIALRLTYPRRSKPRVPSYLLPYKPQSIGLLSHDGVRVSAWYIPGKSGRAVVMLGGIFGDRLEMAQRARVYLEQGFSCLLPDLRGMGETRGGMISFGWHERKDLETCIRFLKRKGYGYIAGHGFSLGAAALLYALPALKKPYPFLVLESCYDTIENALKHRIGKYFIPRLSFLSYSVRFWVMRLGGIRTGDLMPVKFIGHFTGPLLYFAGGSEKVLPLEDTRRMFDACPAVYKKLCVFPKADHKDFMALYPAGYEKHLREFLIGRIPED